VLIHLDLRIIAAVMPRVVVGILVCIVVQTPLVVAPEVAVKLPLSVAVRAAPGTVPGTVPDAIAQTSRAASQNKYNNLILRNLTSARRGCGHVVRPNCPESKVRL